MKNWEIIVHLIDEIENDKAKVKEWSLDNNVAPCEFEIAKDISISKNNILKKCEMFNNCQDCLDYYLDMEE